MNTKNLNEDRHREKERERQIGKERGSKERIGREKINSTH